MFGIILAWLRKQVGQRTDTASATGSVHAKLGALRQIMATKKVIASDTLQFSADTERTTTSSDPVIKKAIPVYVDGTVRVKHDAKSSNAMSGASRVYKNGSEVGALNVLTTSYVTYTADIAVSQGDVLELYINGYAPSSFTAYCRNFRVYFDVPTVDGEVSMD